MGTPTSFTNKALGSRVLFTTKVRLKIEGESEMNDEALGRCTMCTLA